MVLLWGRDGVMIYNDSYTVFAAGRHPRLLGSPVLKGWPEVADFNANVMRVGLSGGTLSYRDQELTLYRKGVPEQVWMNLDYSPVLDESGQPGGVLAIVVETTERVLAERRVSDEGERLRQMFRQAPGFMALLRSPEHIFEIVNASYLQLVGHRGDIVGKPVREALPEIEGQGFFELLDQVFSTGEPFVGRDLPVSLQRLPGSDVEQRFIDLVYQPITDKEGQVTGIFVEGYDVTERVQGETALRESQRRFQTIAEAMPGFAWTADEDGLLDFVSRRWTEYSGANQEQSCGENWLNFVHPDDLQRSLEVWSSSIQSQTPYETEFRLRGKDGTYRWWLARALPVRDEVGSGEQGKAVRWVGTCTDLHERKLAQERQRLVSRELNHRVKNLFAVASGMVALTARSASTPQEMAQTLRGRLNALAQANDLIHRDLIRGERDQDEGTTMETLVRTVLLPYVDEARSHDRECIIVNGPAVPVSGDAVTGLALFLHETTTNAAKYGALSAPDGCVRVNWMVRETDLHLRWEESGGPLVAEPPKERGFGSTLVKRSVTGQLQGTIEYDWRPEGLTVQVTVPLERLNQ
jgi:PAS domain S-box-containing protein